MGSSKMNTGLNKFVFLYKNSDLCPPEFQNPLKPHFDVFQPEKSNKSSRLIHEATSAAKQQNKYTTSKLR